MSIGTLTPRASAMLTGQFGNNSIPEVVTRLPESTRRMAARYLAGEVGATMRCSDFSLDARAANLSLVERYAACVDLIARQAPLRIDAEEYLVGSATLQEACWHDLPASGITIAQAEDMVDPSVPPIRGTSHVTIGFEKLLQVGYQGLRAQLIERQSRGDLDTVQTTYLSAMRTCLEAAGIWHQRHVDALTQLRAKLDQAQRRHIDEVISAMTRVPETPPQTFHEALQCLWFSWTFQRLCGNWSGVGRIDKMLGPYLQRDLAAGRLTLEQARDLLAHFWIKGTEWVGAPHAFGVASSGDAQFYQNVILGGVDEEGDEVVNEVTYLILDIVEELHISDFPIGVRMSERSPAELWRKIAAVQRQGGGIVSIYNDDLVIRALTQFGFPLEEARNFTNDGCWEVLIPGKSAFCYNPFDALHLLQKVLGVDGDSEPPCFPRFENLYQAYLARLAEKLAVIAGDAAQRFNTTQMTAPLLSLLVDDCIEAASDYYQRGAKYSMAAPHAGGLPDVANSLHVIDKAVYCEGRTTLRTLITAMRNNWAGYEELQRDIMQRYVLYGNADPDADAMMRRVFDDYVALAHGTRQCGDVLCPPGISTFGREIDWRNHRLATAFGYQAHAILAGNLSPTPGSEQRGATAVIRSFCRMDFARLPNGVPLDVTLSPSSIAGENGLLALESLLRTFIHLGGWYFHINVLDSATLREAQQHPERFPNLTVRISGWSARFATLNAEWQEMVIQRTVQRG